LPTPSPPSSVMNRPLACPVIDAAEKRICPLQFPSDHAE
jgi:hypothetical protein